MGEDAAASSELVGDPSAVALFVMGRIPAEHESLKVLGDIEAAGRFKAYFPRP